jgi:outer membrane lipoprotein-sorting protein
MLAMMHDKLDPAQADLLDRYWEQLLADPTATVPKGLRPELARFAASMAARGLAPSQDEASTARVRRRVDAAAVAAAAAIPTGQSWPNGARRTWTWPGVFRSGPLRAAVAVATLVLVLVGAYLLAVQPPTVSAQEVVLRAQAAAVSPQAGGVKTFILSSRDQNWDATGRTLETRAEGQRWYAGPDRWRVESHQDAVSADGKVTRLAESVEVSDGANLWQYDALVHRVTVQRASPALGGQQGSVSGFGQGVTDLGGLLAEASRCFTPRLTGSAVVAGRQTYVVDLGATTCPAAALPEFNGRQVIWVDKATSFILKWNLYAESGGKLIAESVVTNVQYNVPIAPERLAFTVPAGASVRDLRPAALATAVVQKTPVAQTATATPGQPAPGAVQPTTAATADPLLAALIRLVGEVDYPLFAPTYVPANLAPRQPRLDPAEGVGSATLRLEYVPSAQITQDIDAMEQGVEITEQHATYAVLASWTDGAIPVSVPTGRAWVRRGVSNADGTGTASTALALHDGTLIAATSFGFSPETLFALVSALQAVPGSHAPQPAPVALTLIEARKQSIHPVFVPTWLPEGLRAEPPVDGRIAYHNASDQRVLTVFNAAPGRGPADPRATGVEVRLTNGVTAHLLGDGARQPGSGGANLLLWWEEDGVNLSLEGIGLDRATLVRIADSMSATADLGDVELPSALAAVPAAGVPTPTPQPTPSFVVLRPTWLPEVMTTREQVDAEGALLGFAPQSAAAGEIAQGVMTLRETPIRHGEGVGRADPEANVEAFGGRQVIVVHRGGECTSYEWTAGDLRLTLTNVYDPPGQIKYSCDVMRRIVESVR